jgi:hypothetical protein
MAHIDIFNQDAFTMGSMTQVVERVPYTPQLLGSLNIFEPEPVRTEFVSVESKDKTLAIIQTSPRGAPLEQGRTYKRKLRRFDTVRLAKADTVRAAEIQNIRAYGSETELAQVQQLVVEKQMTLRNDLELTLEMHRLGAINGKLLDADGSVIYDWFAEWGFSVPAPIEFKLDTATTDVQAICMDILRRMKRASKGAWAPNTYPVALCGDTFYTKFIGHKTIRETYLNWMAAANLRSQMGVSDVQMNGAFAGFKYGGIIWLNYRGVDDFDKEATSGLQAIGIKDNSCKIFPVNAPGVFKRAQSPAESFDYVNTPGRDLYAMLIPDRKRNAYVDMEIYTYPLHICTRPEMLLSGVENTNP